MLWRTPTGLVPFLKNYKDSPFRSRSIVFKLKQWLARPGSHRYSVSCGNSIVFEQDVSLLYHALPWLLQDLAGCVTIVLIAAEAPDRKDATLVKILEVRQQKVRKALNWLDKNNLPWSKHVRIDEQALRDLP